MLLHEFHRKCARLPVSHGSRFRSSPRASSVTDNSNYRVGCGQVPERHKHKDLVGLVSRQHQRREPQHIFGGESLKSALLWYDPPARDDGGPHGAISQARRNRQSALVGSGVIYSSSTPEAIFPCMRERRGRRKALRRAPTPNRGYDPRRFGDNLQRNFYSDRVCSRGQSRPERVPPSAPGRAESAAATEDVFAPDVPAVPLSDQCDTRAVTSRKLRLLQEHILVHQFDNC